MFIFFFSCVLIIYIFLYIYLYLLEKMRSFFNIHDRCYENDNNDGKWNHIFMDKFIIDDRYISTLSQFWHRSHTTVAGRSLELTTRIIKHYSNKKQLVSIMFIYIYILSKKLIYFFLFF